jgi:hypothetical protein
MKTNLLAAISAVTIAAAIVCAAARAEDAAAPALMIPSNPREAGARYGQAAGVALVCYGMRTTGASEVLRANYKGDDLAAFTDQADRILTMWKDTHSCKNAKGPNECRLSQAFSCAEALKEIGPAGSKLRGLVEAKPETAATDAAGAPKP